MEPDTMLYTIVASHPLGSSSRKDKILLSTRFLHQKHFSQDEIKNSSAKNRAVGFERNGTKCLKNSTIKLKSQWFPIELRCEHVQGNNGAGEGWKVVNINVINCKKEDRGTLESAGKKMARAMHMMSRLYLITTAPSVSARRAKEWSFYEVCKKREKDIGVYMTDGWSIKKVPRIHWKNLVIGV